MAHLDHLSLILNASPCWAWGGADTASSLGEQVGLHLCGLNPLGDGKGSLLDPFYVLQGDVVDLTANALHGTFGWNQDMRVGHTVSADAPGDSCFPPWSFSGSSVASGTCSLHST